TCCAPGIPRPGPPPSGWTRPCAGSACKSSTVPTGGRSAARASSSSALATPQAADPASSASEAASCATTARGPTSTAREPDAGRRRPCGAPRSWTAALRATWDSGNHGVRPGGAVQDALGDQAAADSALEHALDLAEPDGALTPFLLAPPPACSTAMPGTAPHRTAQASLLAGIRSMLAG